MFRDVPASSKIFEGFHKLTPSGFRPITLEMQAVIHVADKPKKAGKGSKKGEKTTAAKKVHQVLQNLLLKIERH